MQFQSHSVVNFIELDNYYYSTEELELVSECNSDS